VSQDRRPAGRTGTRAARALVAVLLSFGLLGLAACGFDAQTSQPYTPADGTNLDVGADNQLKVRNLVVISRGKGEGIVSASILSGTGDRLTSVRVVPSPLDGSPGPAVAAKIAKPVELPAGVLVVLTNGPLLTVEAPQLDAGLAASVALTFEQAGEVVMNCPVVDGTLSPWDKVSPSPSPTPQPSRADSPSPTPGRSARPSPSPSPTS